MKSTDINLDSIARSFGIPVPVQPPKQRSFQAGDGNKISGLDWGANGPPVLFLHGGKLTAHTWDMVCAQLQQNYHCVALDLRGHGDSDWCDSYTIPDYVSDVQDVLKQLEWDKAHFVGMSLGGVVSAYTMLSDAPFTRLSLSLVDVAPGVIFENTSRLQEFMRADHVKEGPEAIVAHAMSIGARGTEIQLYYRYHNMLTQNPDKSWSWKSDNRERPDFPHILSYLENLNEHAHKLTWPCLVAKGAVSQILPISAAQAFVTKCPNANLSIIENAGHSVQEDNPVDLASTLHKFWQS